MQAIRTEILPATNTKPTRIKAHSEGGKSLILSYGKAEKLANTYDSVEMAHYAVVMELCRIQGWQPKSLTAIDVGTGYVFSDVVYEFGGEL